jgi:hypothetical protein
MRTFACRSAFLYEPTVSLGALFNLFPYTLLLVVIFEEVWRVENGKVLFHDWLIPIL